MDQRRPRHHLAQGCVVGAVLSGGAAVFALWYVMKYWADCGSGIFAGAAVVLVGSVLTLLNGVVFTLVLAVAGRRVVVGGCEAGVHAPTAVGA